MSRIFELLRQAKLDGDLLQRPVAPPTAVTNSRNFELLHQAQKDELLFGSTDSRAVAPAELLPPRPAVQSGGGEIFKLVQRLFLADSALAPRTVVFCAVEQRSDDNWTCAQAAELLASHTRGSSVCVIDANVARPSLHTYFDVENCGGLAGAVMETGPVVNFTQPLDGGYLRLMPAGELSAGADPSQVLAAVRLRARMSELRARFDYILIDAPPVIADSSTTQLATLVDGFILLVEPSFTPQQAARAAKDNIEAAAGRVLGVVLHRRELQFRPRPAQRQKS
jgi:Cellulose biosynthesis protein BcsQ